MMSDRLNYVYPSYPSYISSHSQRQRGRHTIKPGTPEHGTTEHRTPAERWNNGTPPEHPNTEHPLNDGTTPEQQNTPGTIETTQNSGTLR